MIEIAERHSSRVPTGRLVCAVLFSLLGLALMIYSVLQTSLEWYTCRLPGVGSIGLDLHSMHIHAGEISGSADVCSLSTVTAGRADSLCDNTQLTLRLGYASIACSAMGFLCLLGLFCCGNRTLIWLINMLTQLGAFGCAGYGAVNFWAQLTEAGITVASHTFNVCSRQPEPFAVMMSGVGCFFLSACMCCVCCCSAKSKSFPHGEANFAMLSNQGVAMQPTVVHYAPVRPGQVMQDAPPPVDSRNACNLNGTAFEQLAQQRPAAEHGMVYNRLDM